METLYHALRDRIHNSWDLTLRAWMYPVLNLARRDAEVERTGLRLYGSVSARAESLLFIRCFLRRLLQECETEEEKLPRLSVTIMFHWEFREAQRELYYLIATLRRMLRQIRAHKPVGGRFLRFVITPEMTAVPFARILENTRDTLSFWDVPVPEKHIQWDNRSWQNMWRQPVRHVPSNAPIAEEILERFFPEDVYGMIMMNMIFPGRGKDRIHRLIGSVRDITTWEDVTEDEDAILYAHPALPHPGHFLLVPKIRSYRDAAVIPEAKNASDAGLVIHFSRNGASRWFPVVTPKMPPAEDRNEPSSSPQPQNLERITITIDKHRTSKKKPSRGMLRAQRSREHRLAKRPRERARRKSEHQTLHEKLEDEDARAEWDWQRKEEEWLSLYDGCCSVAGSW